MLKKQKNDPSVSLPNLDSREALGKLTLQLGVGIYSLG
jgi:hypothetical protein